VALAEPLVELEGCRTAFGIQWASMQKLLARVTAPPSGPIPTHVRAVKVALALLERCEEKARATFIQQADCIMVRTQPAILKALAANHRRLLNLPPSHTRATAETLATEHRLLAAQWQATQCLALEWAAVVTSAPWSAWRDPMRLPRRAASLDLCLGWGTGAPAPFLECKGQNPDQIRFLSAEQRIWNMALKSGIDADALTAFDLAAWIRVLDQQRADEGIRAKALATQQALADAARDREQAERARAHQAREAAQKASRRAKLKGEQEAQRQAAARAKEQRKRDLAAHRAETEPLAEDTRARNEREARLAMENARSAEAVRSAREAQAREASRRRAEARDALLTQRAGIQARRAAEAEAKRTAEAEAKRAAGAEAKRTAEAEAKRAAEAEAKPATGAAPRRPDQPDMQKAAEVSRTIAHELRVRRRLLIPGNAPLDAASATRVRAAIRRYRLRNPPALPPAEIPPAPAFSTRLIHPLRGPRPSPAPRTVQRYATSPYPAPAPAE